MHLHSYVYENIRAREHIVYIYIYMYIHVLKIVCMYSKYTFNYKCKPMHVELFVFAYMHTYIHLDVCSPVYIRDFKCINVSFAHACVYVFKR